MIRFSSAATCVLTATIAWATVAAQGPAAPPSPPPGRLVDVGGWQLHLNCTGESAVGQPTVILEPGIGDFSVEWSLVQPRVAAVGRVCSYDRAGDGWSDLGPYPRTLHQIVYELHTLLDKAKVQPPYVLVGHSYGGWLMQLYASTYATQVAGVVLVEPGESDPLRITANGSEKRSSQLVTSQAIPSVKTAGPLRETEVPLAALNQMKAAAIEASRDANPGERIKLPAEAQRMRTWALSRWQHAVAASNPVELEELAALRADHAKERHPLGDVPLIVLTRGMADETGADANVREDEHRKDHAALALLSSRGRLVVAECSGHHVQLDQPDLVAQAIAEVMAAASTR
jgi:pimeloyl-ACP methyl ester carboxylesterase